MSEFSEPIAALITAPGSVHMAIRLSGQGVFEIGGKLADQSILKKYSACRVKIKLVCGSKTISLPVTMLTMPEGYSYTREPVVEIHYPGNDRITSKLLETIFKEGVRPAEPGEFTRRAFLNGRISLSEAEGVASLIRSKSENERNHALKMIAGESGDFLVELKEKLFVFRRDIEARLDFAEEADVDEQKDPWDKHRKDLSQFIENKKISLPEKKSNTFHLRVAILGPANAGKSSLVAALIPEASPLIHATSGTTMDLVPYTILIEGETLILYDSPGFKVPENKLDTLSLDTLKRRLDSFDAFILLNPPSHSLSWIENLPEKTTRKIIFSKADLKIDKVEAETKKDLRVSSRTGQGVAELKNTLLSWSLHLQRGSATSWSALERKMMDMSEEFLKKLAELTASNFRHEELICYELDIVLEELDLILYREGGHEALLDSIFKDFCIGK